MPQKCETRADEARASRNSFGGWFRDPLTPCALRSQEIPPLTPLHICKLYLARLAEGGLRCDHRY